MSLYAGINKLRRFFIVAISVALLSGCAGGLPSYPGWPVTPTTIETPGPEDKPDISWQTPAERRDLAVERAPIFQLPAPLQQAAPAQVKVAIILPLSGRNAALGQSMLKAAQMALFDVGSQNFELMPKDSKDTAEGAALAAQEAVNEGASMILGPVFADHLRFVKPVAAARGVPIISYSTDWKQAGNGTYIMGFMPFTQVARVTGYAAAQGHDRFAVFAPQTEYSDVVLGTLRHAATRAGASVVAVDRFSPQQGELTDQVHDFLNSQRAGLETYRFNAMVLPFGGENLRTVSAIMNFEDQQNHNVRLIGTGLWDDPSLRGVSTLYGGWFAAPNPAQRRDFERRYRENYDEAPIRLATLAYDSTALAAVLARVGGGNPYNVQNMTSPRGFAGVDGIFRFRPDGLVERGLAVLELQAGGVRVVDPAPTAFAPVF